MSSVFCTCYIPFINGLKNCYTWLSESVLSKRLSKKALIIFYEATQLQLDRYLIMWTVLITETLPGYYQISYFCNKWCMKWNQLLNVLTFRVDYKVNKDLRNI